MRSVTVAIGIVCFATSSSALAALNTYVDLFVGYSGELADRFSRAERKDIPANNNLDLGLAANILAPDIAGASAYAVGFVHPASEDLGPSIALSLNAAAPDRSDEFSARDLSAYRADGIVSYENWVRVDLTKTNPFVAAVGLQVEAHGTLSATKAGRGDAGASLYYSFTWGGREVFDEIEFDSFDFEPHHEQDIDRSFILAGGNVLSDLRMRLYANASVQANNSSRHGPSSAKAEFENTFSIVGLIPYDANGNILPADYLVYTTDTGEIFPVLGAPVPEPAIMMMLLTVAAIFVPHRHHRRVGRQHIA